jgi:biopolymer transport protein ExbB
MQREPRKPMNRNLMGFIVSASVMVAAPFVGLLASVLWLRRSFTATAAPSVDPSDKARILAEGISEAMNGVGFGAIFSLLALPLVVLFVVRWRRDASIKQTDNP